MQVACHISLIEVSEIQVIENCLLMLIAFFVVFFGCFVIIYIKVSLFYETLQPKYGNLFGEIMNDRFIQYLFRLARNWLCI